MKKASPVKRVIADLIDGIILIAVKLVIAGSFLIITGYLKSIDTAGTILIISLWIFYFFTITVIFFTYYIFFFSVFSSSPGKMFFNLKVLDFKTRKPITKKQAVLRSWGYLISGAPLYLGIIWILFDKNGQGWHDKIAGTYMADFSDEQ